MHKRQPSARTKCELMVAILIGCVAFVRVEAATFGTNSAPIVNRYMPQNPGAQWSYRGFGELAGMSATALATGIEIVDGVRCVRTDATTGVSEWHAQDTSGAVWRLRESDDEDDYLVMPSAPAVGAEYDLWVLRYRVISTTAVVVTPAGTFSNCLHLSCIDDAWPDLHEYYAPGVGEVKSYDSAGGYELTAVSGIEQPQIPSVAITAIWSEQVAGSRQNRLPGLAGQRSNASGYVLLGGRSDGLAYVGATIQTSPNTPGADVRARILKIDGVTLQPVSTQVSSSGNDYALIFSPSSPGRDVGVSGFRVEAWVEVNGDGVPTPAAGETAVQSQWAFFVITPNRYDISKSGIETEIVGMRAVGWRYAPDFAQIFLNGTLPSYVTSAADSQISANNELSHHVGVLFTGSGVGSVKEYVCDTLSCIAESVLSAAGMHSFLARIVRDARDEIQTFFEQNPASAWYFLYPADSSIVFNDANRDADLAFSIHGASVENLVVSVPRQSSRGVSVSGTIRDLYDWDYEGADNTWLGAFMDPMYASVQAGYGTLGDAGHVFRLSIQFIGDVQTVHYDGACTLRVPGVTGLDAQIDVLGLPGDSIDIEESQNLRTWSRRSGMVLPDSGIGSIEVPISEGLTKFFRAKTIR